MAKRSRNPFGHLSRTLKTPGFKSVKQGGHVVFTHPSGRPEFLLPAYRSGQAVQPIHLMMVRKQLADAGLLKPGRQTLETQGEVATL